MRSILSIGHDLMLLQTRQLMLESGGFHVDIAEDVPTAVALCRATTGVRSSYSVVILCHTLREDEIETICAYLRNTGSHVRVIRLSGVEDVSYDPQRFVSLVQKAAESRAARHSA